MSNRRKIKGEQNLRYNMTIQKKNGAFDILNYISENVTLVQLMNSIGNVNHAISILGHWIFDSKYNSSVNNKLQRFDLYFMLLDIFGNLLILKKGLP